MSNSIRSILEKQKVRAAIIEKIVWYREQICCLDEREDFDVLQRDSLVNAMRRQTLLLEFRTIWREQICSEFDRPAVLTIRDFYAAIVSIFFDSNVEPQRDYDSFVTFLGTISNVYRYSRPIRLITGQYLADPESPELIWSSESGFRVTLVGSLAVRDEHVSAELLEFPCPVTAPRAVYIRIEGRSSSDALLDFRRELFRVLRCIYRSLSLLKHFDQAHLPEFVAWDQKVRLGFHPDYSDDGLVSRLLKAYFGNPTRKDSIDRRVRNALHLLVQSDQQRHTAIGIALAVAAVESLVCRKGGDIASMFSENTAVLLEPDPNFRSDAVEFVKDLYDARSRVLHGELLEHEAIMRRDARVLATAVLQAVLERRDFQRRAGVDSETPDDLINELKRGKWVPGQLTGVSESPARKLWGAKYEGPHSDTEDF